MQGDMVTPRENVPTKDDTEMEQMMKIKLLQIQNPSQLLMVNKKTNTTSETK